MITPRALPVGVAVNKNAYVYLLVSVSTGKCYVGWTTDMQRRLAVHNSGRSKYTSSRGRWELVGCEGYDTTEEAKERERILKRNPRMYSLFKKRLLNKSSHRVVVLKNNNPVAGLKQVAG